MSNVFYLYDIGLERQGGVNPKVYKRRSILVCPIYLFAKVL